MTFKKYQTANNASGFLEASIAPTGDTLIIQTAYADLFPDHNGTTDKDYQLTLEHFIDNKVTKREIVLVKHKVGNVFTVEKANGYCPASWDATTQTNTAFGFSAGDLVELRTTAENDEDIKTELERLETEKLNITEYQAGTYVFGASSTGNDDYAITIPYGPTAYGLGQAFKFQADVQNVGEATLNVNGLGAIIIKKQHNETLAGGDIEAGQIVTVAFDGVNFQMDSQVATIPTIDIHGQIELDQGMGDDEFIVYDQITGGNKKLKSKNIFKSSLSNSDYIAGEAMSMGDSMFPETAPTFAQATKAQNIGDVSANTRYAFPIFGNGISMGSLKLGLKKFVSPSVDLKLRIETNESESPSGTQIAGTSEYTIATSGIGVYIKTTQEADQITLSNNSDDTVSLGYRVLANKSEYISNVVKESGCTATRARLFTDAGVVLATATFSGDTATFITPYLLVQGTYYRVEVDNSGSSYRNFVNTSPGFPKSGTVLNYVAGSSNNGNPYTYAWNIASIGLGGVPIDISLGAGITIPNGQKVRGVLYAGTYGSETVNGTNYFGVAYSTNDTTTRGSKIWNGSSWGTTTTNNITLANTPSQTLTGNLSRGVKFTVSSNAKLKSVNKTSACTATRCRLLDASFGVLATGTVVGNTATFNNYTINSGTTYIVEWDNSGSNYTYNYGTTGSNPSTVGILTITGTTSGGVNDAAISSNVESFVLTYANILFTYISGTGILSTVLSKTDADFTYKLPDIPRLATKAYNAGELVKYDFAGISKSLSGLTEGAGYFVSNTPGQLSTSAGTNGYKMGIGKYGNLLIDNGVFGYNTIGESVIGDTSDIYSSVYKISGGDILNITLSATGHTSGGFTTTTTLYISYDGTNFLVLPGATVSVGTNNPPPTNTLSINLENKGIIWVKARFQTTANFSPSYSTDASFSIKYGKI